jgi:HlyD family secretion protein
MREYLIKNKKWILRIAAIVAAVGIFFFLWQVFQPKKLADGFASGNGRIEATEIAIAAKIPGRIKTIMVDEGDFVEAGQVLVQMDIDVLMAQRREAEAALRQAQSSAESALNQLAQRKSEKVAALAVVAQRVSDLDIAKIRLSRSEILAKDGAMALQELDDDRARVQNAQAALRAAEAQVTVCDAAIASAASQVAAARSAIEASRATIERIQADIDDSALKSPRFGRVQTRVAQPGEVMAAGGRVLNLVDLSDIYMTFFLPTEAAGKVVVGSDARLVFDAMPQYVIPAKISFVSDVAQFTPKTVETAEERLKLMFRVKAQIDSQLLMNQLRNIKTGIPGVAYVRLDPSATWPAYLNVKLPQ